MPGVEPIASPPPAAPPWSPRGLVAMLRAALRTDLGAAHHDELRAAQRDVIVKAGYRFEPVLDGVTFTRRPRTRSAPA